MRDETKTVIRKSGSILGSLFGLAESANRRNDSQVWTEPMLTEWLIQKIADATEIPADQVDLDTPFADFGLDSRTAVALSSDLERMLGRELSPTLIWDYPTIKEVAHHLFSVPDHGKRDHAE